MLLILTFAVIEISAIRASQATSSTIIHSQGAAEIRSNVLPANMVIDESLRPVAVGNHYAMAFMYGRNNSSSNNSVEGFISWTKKGYVKSIFFTVLIY